MHGSTVMVVDNRHNGLATYTCLDGFSVSPEMESINVTCSLNESNPTVDFWPEPDSVCLCKCPQFMFIYIQEPSALEFQSIDHNTLILKIYFSLLSVKFDDIK